MLHQQLPRRAAPLLRRLRLGRRRRCQPYANQGSQKAPIGAALAGRLRQWESGAGLHIRQPPGWVPVTAAAGGARRGAGPDPERAQAGGGGDSSPPGSGSGHVRPRQVRRQSPGQGQVAFVAGRAAVPRGPRAPAAAQRQLRGAGGRRRPGVSGGRAGIPVGRDPGAGGQRGAGQQEDAHHPAAPAAGHPQRRGAQQAAGRRHHRAGRRPAQHPGRAAAQEDAELQEVRPGPEPPPRRPGPALPCPARPAPAPRRGGAAGTAPARLPGAPRRPGPALACCPDSAPLQARARAPPPPPCLVRSGRSAPALPPPSHRPRPRADFFFCHELGKGNPLCTVEAPDCGRAPSLPPAPALSLPSLPGDAPGDLPLPCPREAFCLCPWV